MQAAMDASPSEIKYNVKNRTAGWRQLNQYPVINVKRNYNNNSLNISVDNFNIDIWIFVNITSRTHSDSKKILPAVWLEPHISYHILNIDFLDKNDWILANLQQSGNYKILIDKFIILLWYTFITILLLLYFYYYTFITFYSCS